MLIMKIGHCSVLDCENSNVGNVGVAMTITLGVIPTAGADCKQ